MTTVFMTLAAVMVATGLAALWQSFRGVLGGGPAATGAFGSELPERVALEAEKRTLLRSLKDIEFDRQLGKVSDADFDRLNKAYRRRAKRVLQLLEQDLQPYMERAEREIAKAMGETSGGRTSGKGSAHRRRKGKSKGRAPARLECPSCGVDNALDALHCKGCATRLAPIICEKCGTQNDPDARFCKSCATKVGGSEDE